LGKSKLSRLFTLNIKQDYIDKNKNKNKTNMSEIYVIKRDGNKELLNYEKINKVLLWATQDINGVGASDVAMNAQLQIYDGITTDEIHKVLIQSANDLISEKNS
jgi:ribonucleoside-diphosphate reductase alpha chain